MVCLDETAPKIELSRDREIFGNYFKILKAESVREQGGFNVLEFFQNISRRHQNLSFSQLCFCIEVFSELGILTIESESPFRYKINKIKTDLENSKSYLSKV